MCSGTENPKVEQKARLEALQNALEARSRGHGFYPTGKRNGLPSIVGRPSAIPAIDWIIAKDTAKSGHFIQQDIEAEVPGLTAWNHR